jgi:uncharacterized protein (TIGR01244 family)
MSEFRRVTDRFSVAPQLAVDDMAKSAQQGFVLVINNRPDGEAPDQPTSVEVAEAAEAAGMAYAYVPVVGGPSRGQAEAVRQAVAEAGGPVLAFCRSGTRSINTWALGEAMAGAPRDELIAAAARAGYDLRPRLG